MESKTTQKMFPTLGRLVMPPSVNIEDSDELIYCDWCHWKGKYTGVTPVQYKEQKWTAVDNVNVTVAVEDKKNTTMKLVGLILQLGSPVPRKFNRKGECAPVVFGPSIVLIILCYNSLIKC